MRDAVKRLLDVVLALLALLTLSPVIAAVALLVSLRLGRPVLFRQARPGRGGHPFTMLKFRTMRSVDESAGLVSDADRLTPFGLRLRSSSLDELPALWNVVRGEMSLVGPRPLLTSYLPLYSSKQARRHEVRPGLTGLAQVRGRNSVDWPERLALDVQYVDHRSTMLDLQIVVSTLRTVIRREGICAEGHESMPPFEGTAERDARRDERPTG